MTAMAHTTYYEAMNVVTRWRAHNSLVPGRNIPEEASIHTAAKEFGVDRKRVQGWIVKYDDLTMHSGGAPAKRHRITMPREPMSANWIDRCLTSWKWRDVKGDQCQILP